MDGNTQDEEERLRSVGGDHDGGTDVDVVEDLKGTKKRKSSLQRKGKPSKDSMKKACDSSTTLSKTKEVSTKMVPVRQVKLGKCLIWVPKRTVFVEHCYF